MNVQSLPGPDDIALRRLDNGILLAARENFVSPAVVVSGLLEVGSMDEPAARAGLASMVASLLTRGTTRRGYDEWNESIESVGGSVGVGGRTHTTAASAKSLAEDFPMILDLLVETLRHPAFPEEHLERVRQQRITSLHERENNTRAVAHLRFYESAFPPGHPYHGSSSGYPDTIAAITRDDLVDFHRAYYGPTDAIFVVVGAMPAQAALDQLEAMLGDWEPLPHARGKQHAPPVAPPEEPIATFGGLPGKTQSDIIYGVLTIPRTHPDYLTLQLANTVLGVFGMMGRIGKSVREAQGLAYSARSSLDGTLGPSAWSATAGVAPDKVEQAVASIRAEWLRLGEELVSEAELDDSKTLTTGSLPLRLETNEGVARSLLDILYNDLGLDYLQRYSELIHAISAGEVRRVSQQYFDPARTILSVAGPGNVGTLER